MTSAPSPSVAVKPFTTRIAMLSARHPWITLILWFGLTLGLFGAGEQIGLRTEPGAPTLARLAEDNPGYQVLIDAGRRDTDDVALVISHPTLTIDDEAYRTFVGDLAADLRELTYTDPDDDALRPTFLQLVDVYSVPDPRLAAGLVSADRRTTLISGRIEGAIDVTRPRLEPVEARIAAAREEFPAFDIGYISSAAVDDQIVELINSDLHAAERITLPLTFVILLFAFGSVVAACLPIGLAITALLGSYGLATLYSYAVEPVNATANQLVALMVLAVGVDYSLFIITRFRHERRSGRDRLAAIEVACSTAGRAVFFSGVIVAISLVGLLVLRDDLLTSMGAVTIFGVLTTVLGSLTFLPAAIALLDTRLDWLSLPFLRRTGNSGAQRNGLVRLAMRFPVLVTLIVTALLILAGSPLLRLQLGSTLNNFDSLPAQMDVVQAYQTIEAELPGSEYDLTLDVVIAAEEGTLNDAATQQLIADFQAELLQIDGLSEPALLVPLPEDDVIELRVAMAGTANDERNLAIVGEVRNDLIPEYFDPAGDLTAYVTGTAADTLDEINRYNADVPIVFGVIFAFSFILLLLVFRSLVIPLKALLLNLLSLGASYGALVLIFQDGWLAEVFDVSANGVIQSFVPILMFTILFGLSMDYHLFILSRVKEGVDHGEPTDAAVVRGISETAGTITSAAIIMVAVFGVFATLSMPLIKQLGVGLAVAVAVDATIVRSLLLPASMRLLGEWNWYLPRWLHWLPTVRIEAEPTDDPPGAAAPLPAPNAPPDLLAQHAWLVNGDQTPAPALRPARVIALRVAAEQALREAHWARAIDILTLLRRYIPADEPTALQLAEAHYQNGNTPLALGQLDALAQHYRRTYQTEPLLRVLQLAVAYAPESPGVYRKLVQAYLAAGRAREASETLERLGGVLALQAQPAEAVRSLQQAAEIAWSAGDRLRGIALYRQAVQVQPEDLDARSRLVTFYQETRRLSEAAAEQIVIAQTLQRQQRTEEAIAAWEQVVHLAPDSIPAYYRLARVLIAAEHYERAELIYGRLAQLEPHNPRLITLQAEMRQLALRRTPLNPALPAGKAQAERGAGDSGLGRVATG